ncbi:hypothetical protein X797_012052 [Metarhizium robertsii]|uniref:Uncharacterized protein n=1 Tax=Metarhizium robertsii TaxID=568076 RepID=A0A014QQD4_9HYPO|nr:hypothetical protein X797_012052 [Metarhizium robertsii]
MEVETITREIVHLNRQVAELTLQRDILKDNLTICQYLDKASAKLQGNRISDNELRHCTSLVLLVHGSDEKFKNFVNE